MAEVDNPKRPKDAEETPEVKPPVEPERPFTHIADEAHAELERLALPVTSDGQPSGKGANGNNQDGAAIPTEAMLAAGAIAGFSLWAMFSRRGKQDATPAEKNTALERALSPQASEVETLVLKEIIRDAVVNGDSKTLTQFVEAANRVGTVKDSKQIQEVKAALAEVGVNATWTEQPQKIGNRPYTSVLTLKAEGTNNELRISSREGTVETDRDGKKITPGAGAVFSNISEQAWEGFKQAQLGGAGSDNRYMRTLEQYLTVNDGESRLGTDYRELVRTHSYSVIPNAEINEMAKFIGEKGAFEIGAGTGYNAFLLNEIAKKKAQANGAGETPPAVIAYDNAPVQSGANTFFEGRRRSWVDVQPGSEYTAARHADRTMVLAWPPYEDPFGSRALAEFTAAGGNKLVYIGTGASGCDGDKAFHEMLKRDWTLERTQEVPHWWQEHRNSVNYYVRKDSARPAAETVEQPGSGTKSEPITLANRDFVMVGDKALPAGSGIRLGAAPDTMPVSLKPYVTGATNIPGSSRNTAYVYRDEVGKTRILAAHGSDIKVNGEPIAPELEQTIAADSRITIGDQEFTLKQIDGKKLAQTPDGIKLNGTPVEVVQPKSPSPIKVGDYVILPEKLVSHSSPLGPAGQVVAKIGNSYAVRSIGFEVSRNASAAPPALKNLVRANGGKFPAGPLHLPGYQDVTTDIWGAKSAESTSNRVLAKDGKLYDAGVSTYGRQPEVRITESYHVKLVPAEQLVKPVGTAVTSLAQVPDIIAGQADQPSEPEPTVETTKPSREKSPPFNPKPGELSPLPNGIDSRPVQLEDSRLYRSQGRIADGRVILATPEAIEFATTKPMAKLAPQGFDPASGKFGDLQHVNIDGKQLFVESGQLNTVYSYDKTTNHLIPDQKHRVESAGKVAYEINRPDNPYAEVAHQNRILEPDVRSKYTWSSLPSKEALTKIYDFAHRPGRENPGQIVSVGSGNGYWEHLMSQMGLDVVAYDKAPPGTGTNEFHPNEAHWFDVKEGTPASLKEHPDRILFVSWPHYSNNFGREAVTEYVKALGDRGGSIIYVGEQPEVAADIRADVSLTGRTDMFMELDANFNLEGTARLRKIELGGYVPLADKVYMYDRKAAADRPAPPQDRLTAKQATAFIEHRHADLASAEHRALQQIKESVVRGDAQTLKESLGMLQMWAPRDAAKVMQHLKADLAKIGITADYKSTNEYGKPTVDLSLEEPTTKWKCSIEGGNHAQYVQRQAVSSKQIYSMGGMGEQCMEGMAAQLKLSEPGLFSAPAEPSDSVQRFVDMAPSDPKFNLHDLRTLQLAREALVTGDAKLMNTALTMFGHINDSVRIASFKTQLEGDLAKLNLEVKFQTIESNAWPEDTRLEILCKDSGTKLVFDTTHAGATVGGDMEKIKVSAVKSAANLGDVASVSDIVRSTPGGLGHDTVLSAASTTDASTVDTTRPESEPVKTSATEAKAKPAPLDIHEAQKLDKERPDHDVKDSVRAASESNYEHALPDTIKSLLELPNWHAELNPKLVAKAETARNQIADAEKMVRADIEQGIEQRITDGSLGANRITQPLMDADFKNRRLMESILKDTTEARLYKIYTRSIERADAAYQEAIKPLEGPLKEMEQRFNAGLEKAGITSVKLEIAPEVTGEGEYEKYSGEYIPGQGKVVVSADQVKRGLTPEFLGLIAHEVKHHEQDTLSIRNMAAEEAKKGLSGPDLIAAVQKRFQKEVGGPLDETFAKRVIERTGALDLTPAELARAKALDASTASMGEIFELQDKLMDQWDAIQEKLASATTKEQRNALTAEGNSILSEHRQVYRDQVHEQEARVAENLALQTAKNPSATIKTKSASPVIPQAEKPAERTAPKEAVKAVDTKAPLAEFKPGATVTVNDKPAIVVGETKDGKLILHLVNVENYSTADMLSEEQVQKQGYKEIKVAGVGGTTPNADRYYFREAADSDNIHDEHSFLKYSPKERAAVPANEEFVFADRGDVVARVEGAPFTGTWATSEPTRSRLKENLNFRAGFGRVHQDAVPITYRNFEDGVSIGVPDRPMPDTFDPSRSVDLPREVRIFSPDSGKTKIPLQRRDGWFYVAGSDTGGEGDTKVHVTTTTPSDAAVVDKVLLPLIAESLSSNPQSEPAKQLHKLIVGAKLKDPLYRDPAYAKDDVDRGKKDIRVERNTMFERNMETHIGPRGQNAKHYTIYARTAEDTRAIAQLIDSYLAENKAQNPQLELSADTKVGGVSDGKRLPGTNRVSTARESWPAAFITSDHPDGRVTFQGTGHIAGASVEKDLGRQIRTQYGHEGAITNTDLEKLAADAGIKKGHLQVDNYGKIALIASRWVPGRGDGDLAYVADGDVTEQKEGKTGRHAMTALYEHLNKGRAPEASDPFHYIEVSEATAKKAFHEFRPETIRTDAEFRQLQALRAAAYNGNATEIQTALNAVTKNGRIRAQALVDQFVQELKRQGVDVEANLKSYGTAPVYELSIAPTGKRYLSGATKISSDLSKPIKVERDEGTRSEITGDAERGSKMIANIGEALRYNVKYTDFNSMEPTLPDDAAPNKPGEVASRTAAPTVEIQLSAAEVERRESVHLQAKLFNSSLSSGKPVEASIFNGEFLRPLIANEGLGGTFAKIGVVATNADSARLVFTARDGAVVTPIYCDTKSGEPKFVLADGTKVAAESLRVTAEIPQSLLTAANSTNADEKSGALAKLEHTAFGIFEELHQLSTREERQGASHDKAIEVATAEKARVESIKASTKSHMPTEAATTPVEARAIDLKVAIAAKEQKVTSVEVAITPEGVVQVRDPNKPDSMKPLEHSARVESFVNDGLAKGIEDAQKIKDSAAREKQLAMLHEQQRRYNEVGVEGDKFRIEFHTHLKAQGVEAAALSKRAGEVGGKVLKGGGAAVSILLVLNWTAHACAGQHLTAEEKQKQFSDSLQPKRGTKPVLTPLTEAMAAPPERPVLARGGTDLTSPPKEGAERGDVLAKTAEDQLRADVQKQLPLFLPVLRQGDIEDTVAQLKDTTGLPFAPGLRKSLTEAIGAEGAINLTVELRESVRKGLADNVFKKELIPSLTALYDGTLDASAAKLLQRAIGPGKADGGGVYDRSVLETALKAEIESGEWGPLSQASYASTVRYSTFQVAHNMKFLSDAQYKFIPTDAPFQIPEGLTFKQFQTGLREGKYKIDDLIRQNGINLEEKPKLGDINKLYQNMQWADEAQKQIEDGFREAQYKDLHALLARMDRPSWIPSEKISGDNKAWERRLQEAQPAANTFAQMDGTLKALESLTHYRDAGSKGWLFDVREVLGCEPETLTTWMDNALQTVPRNKDGDFDIPKTLEDTTENRERLARCQAWLDKYKDNASSQYMKVLERVRDGQYVTYGDRPKIEGIDPELSEPYNLVRDNFSTSYDEEKKEYEIKTTSKYCESGWVSFYDMWVKEVDTKTDTLKAKNGELVPVFVPSAGSMMLMESNHLPNYKASEAIAYWSGKTFEVGLDVAMIATGGKVVTMTAKEGFKQAAKEATKLTYKQAMKVVLSAALSRGGFDLAIGTSGIFLNNAKARYDSKIGQTLNTLRHGAFVLSAGHHIGDLAATGATRLMGKAVGGLKGASSAGEVQKAFMELSTLGKAGRIGEIGTNVLFAASIPYFLPPMLSEAKDNVVGEHHRANLGEAVEAFSGNEAFSNLLKMSSERSVSNDGNRKQMENASWNQVTGLAVDLLAPGKTADQKATLFELAEETMLARDLPPDDVSRKATAEKIAKTFTSSKNPDEKLQAAVMLMSLGTTTPEGRWSPPSVPGVTKENLTGFLQKTMRSSILSPTDGVAERALIAGRARMMIGDMPVQEFGHLCKTIFKADASVPAKTQALAGLGMSLWNAQDKEQSLRSSTERFEYLSKSHGGTAADLETYITEIARGTTSGSTPDFSAYAAGVLHALKRNDVGDRVALLKRLNETWQANSKTEGAFSSALVNDFTQQLKFVRPSDSSQYEAARSKQFMAASALLLLPDGARSSELDKQVNTALADGVNPKSPHVAIQALSALLPGRLNALPQSAADVVRLNAANLLRLGNESANVDIKMATMALMPSILGSNGSEAQRNNAVDALESLVFNKPQNRNYAAEHPGIRLLAVETLAAVRSEKSQDVLKGLLVLDKNGVASEPNEATRIAALQALSLIVPKNNPAQNQALREFIKNYSELERAPRAKAVADGLAQIRVQQPIPLSGEKWTPAEKSREQEIPPPKPLSEAHVQKLVEFLNYHTPNLNKASYDKLIAASSPDYSGFVGQFRAIKDQLGYDLAHGNWGPGESPGAWAYRKGERNQISSNYQEDFDKLTRWAGGEFGKMDKFETSEHQHVQKYAIQSLSYLARTGGTGNSDTILRDQTRVNDAAVAAKTLSLLCGATDKKEIRAQAKDAVVELLQVKELEPLVRYQLLLGLGKLYDFSSDQIKANTRSQALLSKEEASTLVAMSLDAARHGKLPEDTPKPTGTNAAKKWEEDARTSIGCQIDLMKRLVEVHQNREAASNILREIRQTTSSDRLREQAKHYLSLTYGVSVRDRFASRTATTANSDTERAASITGAISKVTDRFTAHEAIDVMLAATRGKAFRENDPRNSVLRSALNNENDLVRLGAAFSLLSKESAGSSPTDSPARSAQRSLNQTSSMETLADLAANSPDEHVRHEAAERIKKTTRDCDVAANNTRVEYELLLEKPGATAAEIHQAKTRSVNAEGVFQWIKNTEKVARDGRLGVTRQLDHITQGPQDATIETRVQQLERLASGKTSADPARVIFNACHSSSDNQNTASQSLAQADAPDPRFEQLQNLSASTNLQTRTAANIMLAQYSKDPAQQKLALDTLIANSSERKSGILAEQLTALLPSLIEARATASITRGDQADASAYIAKLVSTANGAPNTELATKIAVIQNRLAVQANNAAVSFLKNKEPEKAVAFITTSISLTKSLRDGKLPEAQRDNYTRWGTILHNLADEAVLKGDYDQAARALRPAVEVWRGLDGANLPDSFIERLTKTVSYVDRELTGKAMDPAKIEAANRALLSVLPDMQRDAFEDLKRHHQEHPEQSELSDQERERRYKLVEQSLTIDQMTVVRTAELAKIVAKTNTPELALSTLETALSTAQKLKEQFPDSDHSSGTDPLYNAYREIARDKAELLFRAGKSTEAVGVLDAVNARLLNLSGEAFDQSFLTSTCELYAANGLQGSIAKLITARFHDGLSRNPSETGDTFSSVMFAVQSIEASTAIPGLVAHTATNAVAAIEDYAKRLDSGKRIEFLSTVVPTIATDLDLRAGEVKSIFAEPDEAARTQAAGYRELRRRLDTMSEPVLQASLNELRATPQVSDKELTLLTDLVSTLCRQEKTAAAVSTSVEQLKSLMFRGSSAKDASKMVHEISSAFRLSGDDRQNVELLTKTTDGVEAMISALPENEGEAAAAILLPALAGQLVQQTRGIASDDDGKLANETALTRARAIAALSVAPIERRLNDSKLSEDERTLCLRNKLTVNLLLGKFEEVTKVASDEVENLIKSKGAVQACWHAQMVLEECLAASNNAPEAAQVGKDLVVLLRKQLPGLESRDQQSLENRINYLSQRASEH